MEKSYLQRRQEEEAARAANASSDEARASHEALARQYADRLAALFPNPEPA